MVRQIPTFGVEARPVQNLLQIRPSRGSTSGSNFVRVTVIVFDTPIFDICCDYRDMSSFSLVIRQPESARWFGIAKGLSHQGA